MCVMSRPSKRIVPLVGSSSRMIRRAVVVLPQPVSPTIPSVSPRSTSKETPSTACTAPIWRWKMIPRVSGKCLTRSRTSTSASLMPRPPARPLHARPAGSSPRLSSLQRRLRVGSSSRQATRCAGSSGTGSSSGPLAGGARARTGSADGRSSRSAARSGSAAARGSGPAARRGSGPGAGSTAAGPRCTDARGRRRSTRSGASSITSPAYMTAIWSVCSATTPRSCVIRTTRHVRARAAGARSGPGSAPAP